MELNEDALDNQVLDIVRFRGRSKQGTIISFDASTIDKVNLNQKSEADPRFDEFIRDQGGVKAYLAIPHLKMSRKNVALNGSDPQARFVASVRQFEDESTGGNPQDIETKDLNVQILF